MFTPDDEFRFTGLEPQFTPPQDRSEDELFQSAWSDLMNEYSLLTPQGSERDIATVFFTRLSLLPQFSKYWGVQLENGDILFDPSRKEGEILRYPEVVQILAKRTQI